MCRPQFGRGVALLAADWVARNTVNHARLYSFGAPRVGTEWFVKSTTDEIDASNMFRMYHRTDPVSMVALYPFMHTPGYFIDSTEPLTTGEAHKMAKYQKSVEGKSWKQLSGVPEHHYGIDSAVESWLQSKSPVSSASSTFWRWIDSALIYVLKTVAMQSILALQSVMIGAFTLADKIAYILAKGIELADNISIWVEHLMRKMMQALGMRIVKAKEELTRTLITSVLRAITEMANRDASNALKLL